MIKFSVMSITVSTPNLSQTFTFLIWALNGKREQTVAKKGSSLTRYFSRHPINFVVFPLLSLSLSLSLYISSLNHFSIYMLFSNYIYYSKLQFPPYLSIYHFSLIFSQFLMYNSLNVLLAVSNFYQSKFSNH